MKRVKIYQNGKALSPSRVKAIIRKELHLSKRGYEKYYDITRNKLRNYERATGAKPQSTLQFLYNRANYKIKARADRVKYEKSYKARYIESFTSRSSGKSGYGKLEKERIFAKTEKHIQKTMGEFIKDNPNAKLIYEELKDNPISALQALKAYADTRKDYQTDVSGKVKKTDKAVFGGTGGTNNDYDDDALYDILNEYGGGSYRGIE